MSFYRRGSCLLVTLCIGLVAVVAYTPSYESLSTCKCLHRAQIRSATVTHAGLTDAFWDPIRDAVQRAGLDLGIDSTYRTPERGNDIDGMSRILRDLASESPVPAALQISLPDIAILSSVRYLMNGSTDGMMLDSLEQATMKSRVRTSSQYPRIITALNAGAASFHKLEGFADWQQPHRTTFVGQIDYNLGYQFGQTMIERGVTKALCLLHQANNGGVIQRCQGIDAAFHAQLNSSVPMILAPSDNPASARTIIQDALNGDPMIRGILAPGALYLSTSQVVQTLQLGALFQVATTFSASLETDVRDGNLTLATSQVQYLQGYLPVALSTLSLTTRHQMTLPDGVFESGPAIVTPTNVRQYVCMNSGLVFCDIDTTITLPPGCACIRKSERRVVFVTNAQITLPYWQLVQSGIDLAVRDLNLTATHLHPTTAEINDDVAVLRYFQQAVTLRPSVIVISISHPDLLPLIAAARSGGIVVLGFERGGRVATNVTLANLPMFVGPDDAGAGAQIAVDVLIALQQMSRDDRSKHVALCLHHFIGDTQLDERCEGFANGLRDSIDTRIIFVDGSNPTYSQQLIGNALTQAKLEGLEVVAILATGPAGLRGLLNMMSTTTNDGLLNTLISCIGYADGDHATLDAWKRGQLFRLIDLQPFAQGYIAALLAGLYAFLGTQPRAMTLWTGRQFVTEATEPWRRCELTLRGWTVCRPEDEIDLEEQERMRMEELMLQAIVPAAARIGILAFAGFAALLTTLALVGLWLLRKQRVFFSASIVFCGLVLVGCMMLLLSTVMVVMRDTSVDMCNAHLVLMHLGFDMIMGSVLIKTHRLDRIFNTKQLRTIRITDTQLLVHLAVVCALDATLLIVWRAMAPYDANVTYACVSSHDVGGSIWDQAFTGALWAFKSLVLIGTCVLTIKVRKLPSMFNESAAMLVLSYGVALLGLVGLTFLQGSNTSIANIRIVTALLLVVGVLLTIGSMFAPKFWYVWKARVRIGIASARNATALDTSTTTEGGTNTGMGQSGAALRKYRTKSRGGLSREVLQLHIEQAQKELDRVESLVDEENARHVERAADIQKDIARAREELANLVFEMEYTGKT